MCAKSDFRSTYALVRKNRGSIHFAGQFFSFAGTAEIFVAPGGSLVIARKGTYADTGLYTKMLLGNARGLASTRRHFIERARDASPIPLP